VYLLDLAEDKAIPLAQGDLSYTDPLWSPDGKMLLARSAPPGSPVVVDIWVMAANGSGLLNLTEDLPDSFAPNWSPDSEWIAFASESEGDYEIYAARVDGSERVRLTNDPAFDLDPSWSPDGKKLAFISDRHNGDRKVYVMNVDGSGIMRLTDITGEARFPQWSPSGGELAFVLDDSLWLMNADGSNQRKVSGTVQVASFLAPRWSPDGRWVLFTGRKPAELHDNVFYVGVNDQAPTRLTDDSQDYVSGSWSPDGERVAVIAIPQPFQLLQARFTAGPRSGDAPMPVQFSNTSSPAGTPR
jgi:Tol biopolymer transport system component